MPYIVFVSHGWHDRWIAHQIAREIGREAGAEVFIDIWNVQSGDRIEEKVREGLVSCTELVALLTPWSVNRNWVWSEIGSAWGQRKRYVGITYGLTLEQIEREHGGLAVLAPTNVIQLNDLDTYLRELRGRVRLTQDA